MTIARTPRNLAFVLGLWLVSRAIVCLAFAFAAPHGWWEAFGHWDGAWYLEIAQRGYTYALDGKQHSVAFFPLYPLAIALLSRVGVPALAAAVAINNLAMLAALFLTYELMARRAGSGAARWTCAVVALFPMSLFTTVAYAEGLFLCLSALVLLSYDRKHWLSCGIAGALASAVRPTGAALAAAIAVSGMLGRRLAPVFAGVAALAGLIAFAIYCRVHFGDALAFVHAQQAWRGHFGFSWAPWFAIVQMGFARSKWFGHVIALIALVSAVRLRRIDAVTLSLGAVAAFTEAHLWSFNACAATLLFLGSAGVAAFRKPVGLPIALYALFVIATLLASGTPFSIDRNAYGILPLDIGVALLAQRYPAVGYPALVVMAYGLAYDAAEFARFHFVA